MKETNKLSEEMNFVANILAKDMLERKCAWANRIGKLRKEQVKETFFKGAPTCDFQKMCPNGLTFPMETVEEIWSRVCKGDVALDYGDDGICHVHWLVRVEDLEDEEQLEAVYYLAKFIYDNYGDEVFKDIVRNYISQPSVRSFSQTPFRQYICLDGRFISYPKSIVKKIVSAIEDKKLSFKVLEDGNIGIETPLDPLFLVEDLWKKVA